MSKEPANIAEEAQQDMIRAVLPRIKKDFSPLSQQKFIVSRVDLVRAYQFLGFLVMSTEYFFTDDISTMAATTIRGNKIYINEKFINEVLVTRKQRSFVIAHEILHIFLEHIGRQTSAGYHRKLWNVATDYCINSFLVELKSDHLEMPVFGLYDARFKGMGGDQIYHILLEENGNNAEQAAAAHGAGAADDEDDYSTPQPLDEVSAEEVSEATQIENRQKIAGALNNENANALKNMGNGASDLIKQLEDIIESKIPWTSLLREYVTESAKTHSTYNRIGRRSTSTVIFPSMTGEHISIVFGVDTSGSMSDNDLTEALSELHSIIDEYDSWTVELISCDTYAHVIGSYSSEEGDEWGSIDTGLVGGGGTELSPMIEYANEMEETPNICIILTDGYIPEEPYDDAIGELPVITVVTSSGNESLELGKSPVLQMNDY